MFTTSTEMLFRNLEQRLSMKYSLHLNSYHYRDKASHDLPLQSWMRFKKEHTLPLKD